MSVVFYSGESCPVCKVMEPVIRELYPDVQVVKLTSESYEIELLGIRTVPVIMTLNKYGKENGRIVGGISKAKLKEFLVDKEQIK